MATQALEASGDSPLPPAMPQVEIPSLCLRNRAWREMDTPAEIARWDALAQWAAEPNPFFESWYLLPSLRALDPAEEVRLICLEADGQLAGIIPMKAESSYYGRPLPHWRTWIHPNSFLGLPLIAKGFEVAFWREFGRWADGLSIRNLFVHLTELPLHGGIHAALKTTLAETGRGAALVHRYERALLHSELGSEGYYTASVSKKRRKEYGRLERRLRERGDLGLLRQTGDDDVDRWIDEFLHLERAGWKGSEGSALASDARTEALFRETVRAAAERGRLERLSLRLDGSPVAFLANFIASPGAFSFKTAYDERFADYSPGVHLQREFLTILDREDVAWTDSCAAPDHPMIDHFWRERRTIGRINLAVGNMLRRSIFSALARIETGSFERRLP